ncbi:hypothetical protein [Solidesulfovibrio magneticus]|uniref:Hypothetical membrane protein n=1 Tax=Solidesulfovibrio magneticus (strain ATCC 700980 / DSM 13731 / RS-1) TaxID=573370 RepID=C4XTQ7_SOLM1|nr:hypothetical protein [Solidesulfovibrio magneticus]BAH73572.1 hypothetical membrane protein [Solidesulfovibrio magneticus RS-1]
MNSSKKTEIDLGIALLKSIVSMGIFSFVFDIAMLPTNLNKDIYILISFFVKTFSFVFTGLWLVHKNKFHAAIICASIIAIEAFWLRGTLSLIYAGTMPVSSIKNVIYGLFSGIILSFLAIQYKDRIERSRLVKFIDKKFFRKNYLKKISTQLNESYAILLLTSEPMMACNQKLIQQLHEECEQDPLYKNFQHAVKCTAFSIITDPKENTLEYIKELESEIVKHSEIVHEALKKYDVGGDFWSTLKIKSNKEYYNRTLYAFYFEHYLRAQHVLLSYWTKYHDK